MTKENTIQLPWLTSLLTVKSPLDISGCFHL